MKSIEPSYPIKLEDDQGPTTNISSTHIEENLKEVVLDDIWFIRGSTTHRVNIDSRMNKSKTKLTNKPKANKNEG